MKIEQIKIKYNERREIRRSKNFKIKREILRAEAKRSGKRIIILSSDCTGGRLMKDYALELCTPTVNNWYSAKDFIKICSNPDYYFSQKVSYIGLDENMQHMGKIDDVIIHFGHTASYEESLKKWNSGCKSYFRAKKSGNYEICIIQNDRNGYYDDLDTAFNNLPYIHKVLFTHKKNNMLDSFYMENEDEKEYVDVMTKFENVFSLKRRYDRFDFYNWFLEMYKNDVFISE